MMNGNPSSAARNRYPFTATQWQELEHQALIFKYMASGVPIPNDLVYSFKRRLDSSISSRLFPHHPMGWGCYEMGFGRKVDPEPGRCRRTDGKKWRCSKEAYPDSKYCERHMHRGRNRSRKPVEVSSSSSALSSPTAASTATAEHLSSPSATSPSSSLHRNLCKTSSSSYTLTPLSSSISTQQTHQSNSSLYPFLNYPYSSSSSSSTPQLFLNSASYSDKDYRYLQGAKEGVDELAFFPDSSANERNLLMNSYRGYSPTQQSQEDQQQHCFVWGTDFKSVKTEKESAAAESQKSLHHFFGEWQQPAKSSGDTWLDLASNSGCPNGKFDLLSGPNTSHYSSLQFFNLKQLSFLVVQTVNNKVFHLWRLNFEGQGSTCCWWVIGLFLNSAGG
ncbi:hypothetical protein FF2_045752 [Malus domestica]